MTTPTAPRSACDDGPLFHPLEIIPVFRRWRRGHLRNFVYTIIWNTLIAVIMTGFAGVFDARTPIA